MDTAAVLHWLVSPADSLALRVRLIKMPLEFSSKLHLEENRLFSSLSVSSVCSSTRSFQNAIRNLSLGVGCLREYCALRFAVPKFCVVKP